MLGELLLSDEILQLPANVLVFCWSWRRSQVIFTNSAHLQLLTVKGWSSFPGPKTNTAGGAEVDRVQELLLELWVKVTQSHLAAVLSEADVDLSFGETLLNLDEYAHMIHQSERLVGVATRWAWLASGWSLSREQVSRRKPGYQSVIMACLMAAWSIHNPTVTNSIIMVSTPPGPDRTQTGPRLDLAELPFWLL